LEEEEEGRNEKSFVVLSTKFYLTAVAVLVDASEALMREGRLGSKGLHKYETELTM